jgi:hypothetical protein
MSRCINCSGKLKLKFSEGIRKPRVCCRSVYIFVLRLARNLPSYCSLPVLYNYKYAFVPSTNVFFSPPSSFAHRDKTVPAGKLSYKDFIWFLLSEEDKTTQRSIEYWFRCLDVDGDGVLSLYELQLFYEEVLQRLRELSIECLSVENTVCQVLDMVNPRLKNCISLSDLKACKLTPAFLNTFINVEKYLEFEQRDLVTMARDDAETPCSEWDRYAAEQYEILLAEEAGENETSNADDETGDSDVGEEEKEMLALL